MVDTRGGCVRAFHDHARQHDRERRAADDRARPSNRDLGARVGRERLRAHLRSHHADGRKARRHARPPQDLHRRPRHLHTLLAGLRACVGPRDADRSSHRPGSRRRVHEPGDALDHHGHVPAAAARDGDRHLGRHRRHGARDRPAARRRHHPEDRLELDLLRERPGRNPRDRRRPACDSRVARHLCRAATRPAGAPDLRESGSSRSRTG